MIYGLRYHFLTCLGHPTRSGGLLHLRAFLQSPEQHTRSRIYINTSACLPRTSGNNEVSTNEDASNSNIPLRIDDTMAAGDNVPTSDASVQTSKGAPPNGAESVYHEQSFGYLRLLVEYRGIKVKSRDWHKMSKQQLVEMLEAWDQHPPVSELTTHSTPTYKRGTKASLRRRLDSLHVEDTKMMTKKQLVRKLKELHPGEGPSPYSRRSPENLRVLLTRRSVYDTALWDKAQLVEKLETLDRKEIAITKELNLVQLRRLCKDRGVKKTRSVSRDNLIKKLKELDDAKDEEGHGVTVPPPPPKKKISVAFSQSTFRRPSIENVGIFKSHNHKT